jgi:predicted nuclease of predicted toxin-antitoxin system
MRILVDMNLTPRWAQFLAVARYESVHWSAIGPGETSDADIFAYAREHDYVILTNDLDFPQMLSHTRAAKPSVILLRGQPLTPEVRGGALLVAINTCAAELASGAILTIDWSDKLRARVLPLS